MWLIESYQGREKWGIKNLLFFSIVTITGTQGWEACWGFKWTTSKPSKIDYRRAYQGETSIYLHLHAICYDRLFYSSQQVCFHMLWIFFIRMEQIISTYGLPWNSSKNSSSLPLSPPLHIGNFEPSPQERTPRVEFSKVPALLQWNQF